MRRAALSVHGGRSAGGTTRAAACSVRWVAAFTALVTDIFITEVEYM